MSYIEDSLFSIQQSLKRIEEKLDNPLYRVESTEIKTLLYCIMCGNEFSTEAEVAALKVRCNKCSSMHPNYIHILDRAFEETLLEYKK